MLTWIVAFAAAWSVAADAPRPFGDDFPKLDSWAVGEWWAGPGTTPDADVKPA